MDAYREGRDSALSTLGLRPEAEDTSLVADFVAALGDDGARTPPRDSGGNRPLHRQTWGKAIEYSSSDQIFNGGGARA